MSHVVLARHLLSLPPGRTTHQLVCREACIGRQPYSQQAVQLAYVGLAYKLHRIPLFWCCVNV